MIHPAIAMTKQPFNIQLAVDRLREAVRPLPKAALFQLAEEGYRSLFEQLVACIISVRTYDETTLVVARRLFVHARTSSEMIRLTPEGIGALISACTYPEPKSRQIHEIARRAVTEHGGQLPCDEEALRSLPGVGPKCANLALGIACGLPAIGVDVHVHRVTNRWGYVRATTPEKTLALLQQSLPRQFWVEINALLVPFGKHVCLGNRPRCSTCPLFNMCRQVGATDPR